MLKFILIVAAGYALLVAVVYLMQGRMLYLATVPGRELTATPADIGLAYEDVAIETADGVRLHGWFIPGGSSRVLLFFHGNAGNISHRLHSIRQFLGLGLSVLIIDYRGYGESGGKTTEKGMRASGRDHFIRPFDGRVSCGEAGNQAATAGADRRIIVYVCPRHRPGNLSLATGALAQPPATCNT
jgi:pimeloyl-ACP methyl ester carboxylesterase